MLGQEDWLTISGADIYYEELGKGEPLVLLHAVPLDSRMWEPQMSVLSERFRVIRFDIRGLGKSSDSGVPFALYEDIRELLRKLEVERAVFLGVSFGAYTGVEFALAYPDLVKGLILACPGGFNPPSEDWRLRLGKVYEQWGSGHQEQALEGYLHLLLDGPDQRKGRVQQGREWLKGIYRELFESTANPTKPKLLDPHPSERLGEVRAPVWVLSGELDHLDFIRTAEGLSSQIPHAKLVRLASSAHFPNIDCPSEFNEIVTSFLTSLDK